MGMREKRTAKLLRVQGDVEVWRYRGATLRVVRLTTRTGYYAPFLNRRDMYRGRQDPRCTDWFAEGIRASRVAAKSDFRAVRPGPQ